MSPNMKNCCYKKLHHQLSQGRAGYSELLKENNKDAITQNNVEVNELVIEMVAQNDDPKKPGEKYSNEREPLRPLLAVDNNHKAICEKRVPTKIYGQSKSLVIDDGKKKMNKSGTTKVEAKVEEANEFAAMTNEELNRRVEVFIQKFNSQD